MKALITFISIISIFSTNTFAKDAIYCRHISTPDNSQLFLNYSVYDFDVLTDNSGIYSKEQLINREISTGKTNELCTDFKKMSRVYTENTLEIDTGIEKILIVKGGDGKLFRHIYSNECSNFPPFTCKKVLQKLQCTENPYEMSTLQYPPKESAE